MPPIRLIDIAKETGYSIATVSLVLSGKGDRFSMQTIQLIRDTAQKLEYHPNRKITHRVGRSVKSIGMVFPDFNNAFFATVAQGVEDQCSRNGYHVVYSCTNDHGDKDFNYIQLLHDGMTEGALCICSGNNLRDHQEELEEKKIPLILMDRLIEEFPVEGVTVDHERGGYLAARHLCKLGHRKIGCISGPMHLMPAKQRLYGYIRALQEFQIPFDPELVLEGDFHIHSGYDLAGRLLNKGITALFACNDPMAYGACKLFRERGLVIPQDISVVGFDDSEISDMCIVPLTTVGQPAYQIGKTAVEKLITKIRNPTVHQENVILEPHLVVRKSTCPPTSAEIGA